MYIEKRCSCVKFVRLTLMKLTKGRHNEWRTKDEFCGHTTPDTFFSQSNTAPPIFFNMLSCDKNVDFLAQGLLL